MTRDLASAEPPPISLLPAMLACCVTFTSGAAVTSCAEETPFQTSAAWGVVFFSGAAATSAGLEEAGEILPGGPVTLLSVDGARVTAEAVERGVYEVRPGAEDILAREPSLALFLPEVCAKVREVFGGDADLALERFDDPEAPQSEPMLFVLVKTRLDGRTAATALERFHEEWWLDNMGRAQGKLEVSVEFG
ncbi:MAG: hypothetical protein HY744_26340 [Deltaproteobacteria bacterium]|nr:hypothetical protein [Deltaproteobacteria bacterium]